MDQSQQTISCTLQEIAELTSSKLVGNASHRIYSLADLESAQENDASFLANLRYVPAMRQSKAGVIFVDAKTALVEGRNFLINDNPSKAFQILIQLFNPSWNYYSAYKGVHPSAVIHEDTVLGRNVSIGPCAVIDKDVKIGDNTTIGAGCYIGPFCKVGNDCQLHPNVTLRENCELGNRVILQPGVVIGSCGFGYTTDARGQHTKLEQAGRTVLEDDVEIGANTTIDRARFTETRIKKGTKIDNLVQIAHGVTIGEHNLIIAQTGIAGSSKTGKHVILAGQSALVGHVSIADGVIIAARGAASKSIKEAGTYAGAPAVPLAEHHRQHIYMRNIEKFVKKIEELEKRLASLEKESED